jgi:signal transduction histidine kinase
MRRNCEHASTIRGQLTRIVLIPSLCFLALWLVVAAVGTVEAVGLMGDVRRAAEGTEVLSQAAAELRAERRATLVHLGRSESEDTGDQIGPQLAERRESTDAALGAAVDLAERLRHSQDEEVGRSAADVAAGPAALAQTRDLVDDGAIEREEALLRYGDMIGATQSAVTALVHATEGGENLTDAVLTRELMGAHADYDTADALLAGVIAGGEMSYQETAHFTYLTASYRSRLATVAPGLHPTLQRRYEAMAEQDAWLRAEELSRQVVTRTPIVEREREDGVLAAGEPVAEWNTEVGVDAAEWDDSSADSALALGDLARHQAERTVDLAWSAALLRVSLGVAAAVLTLGGGVAAIAVVGRSSRRLTDRLVRLRSQILDRDDDLPDIVDRAQRGQRVDVQEELPPLDDIGPDEIGQVAEAFDTAQLTAVEAAVRQAEIRRGANRAYLGIAFRNQNLVQRQLRLLDEIEYNEQDPEALRRLFRLDHLATRARRYADNLIILGGGQSVRRWRQPRPLVDVLRAAIAETEDFDRVRLTSAPRVLMHGQAVADVVHLLAELVENATQFSPAGTPVDVSCAPVVGGLTVEVEDRGLGMSEHGYAAAERTLTQPPEFDVMELPDDPRLGLFVVARLAERHGVRVWLRPSSYGGTLATALLPESILEPVESPVAVSATAPGDGPGRRRAAAGSPGEPSNGPTRTPAGTGPQTPVVHGSTGPQVPVVHGSTGPQVPVHDAHAVRGGHPSGTGPQRQVDPRQVDPRRADPRSAAPRTGPQRIVVHGAEGVPGPPEPFAPPGDQPSPATGTGSQRPVTPAERGDRPGERPPSAHGTGPQRRSGPTTEGSSGGREPFAPSDDRLPTVSGTGPFPQVGPGRDGTPAGPGHGAPWGDRSAPAIRTGPQQPGGAAPEHAGQPGGPAASRTGPQPSARPGQDGYAADPRYTDGSGEAQSGVWRTGPQRSAAHDGGGTGYPGRPLSAGDHPTTDGEGDPPPSGSGHSARQDEMQALFSLAHTQASMGGAPHQTPEGSVPAERAGDIPPPPVTHSGPQTPVPHHGPAGTSGPDALSGPIGPISPTGPTAPSEPASRTALTGPHPPTDLIGTTGPIDITGTTRSARPGREPLPPVSHQSQDPDLSPDTRAPLPQRVRPAPTSPTAHTGAQPSGAWPDSGHPEYPGPSGRPERPGWPDDPQAFPDPARAGGPQVPRGPADRPGTAAWTTPPDGFGRVLAPDTPPEEHDEA